MIIVKLGGSLYHNPQLTAWLTQLLHQAQHQPIIIVPGGGPFANTARQADQHYTLSPTTAHHLGLLAMQQFGLVLLDLCPQAHAYYHRPHNEKPNPSTLSIWLPDATLLSAPDLAHSWDVTSDTLALWLAQQCQADLLALLKHDVLPPYSLDSLSQQAIIDPAFQHQYRQAPLPTTVVDANRVQLITPSSATILT